MMLPTITDFERALTRGCASFATLGGFAAVCRGGRPVLRTTSLFAEAEIERDGRRWLLCAPLRPEAVRRAESSAAILRRAASTAFAEYRILPDEFRFTDAWGRECTCDLLLHGLPEGETLDAAVTHIGADRLMPALGALREEFRRLGICHRNLKPSNLVWDDDGRLWPLRCHYLTAGNPAGAVDAEFGAVADFVTSHTGALAACALRAERDEECRSGRLRMYDEVWPLHDMMQMVRREALYGYADAEGRTVIEPRFTYAEHFAENRAVVELGRGRQGVIDRRGDWIVEPVYGMIRWTEDGNFRVLRDGLTGEIGYTGEVLEPLHEGGSFVE